MMKDSVVSDPWNNDGWCAALDNSQYTNSRGQLQAWVQLKLPMVRGWDLVILDPRGFIAIVRLIIFKDWFKPIQSHHLSKLTKANNTSCSNFHLWKKYDANYNIKGLKKKIQVWSTILLIKNLINYYKISNSHIIFIL